PPERPEPKRKTTSCWDITKMVIWGVQVAIRGTVSLTAYKTQLKNAMHRLNEATRRRILQMVQPLS
ncbi:IS4 family transposase, partial [Klebsiella pneumoniae]|nr:IS4 family transposase [Klebsiella pneumoniae]